MVATGYAVINRLTVVCPTWSTCCNIQPQKMYDVLADVPVAFDVIRCVSEALVHETSMMSQMSYVHAPLTTSSLCVTFSYICTLQMTEPADVMLCSTTHPSHWPMHCLQLICRYLPIGRCIINLFYTPAQQHHD